MAGRRLDGSYQTIGAISGNFYPREKTQKGLTSAERARVQSALETARSRGMDADASRTYVLERLAFDHPTAPGGTVIEYLATLGSTS